MPTVCMPDVAQAGREREGSGGDGLGLQGFVGKAIAHFEWKQTPEMYSSRFIRPV